MPKFLFTYHPPKDYVAGRPDMVEAWMGWFTTIGSDVVEMGLPVTTSDGVGNCSEDTRLGGYSIISADDLDAAKTIAKGCPAFDAGGGVEVGELGELPSTS
jgi:hypothetical protein